MEELYEPELLWPESFEGPGACDGREEETVSNRQSTSTSTTTAPMNIPSGRYGVAPLNYHRSSDVKEEEEKDEEEAVVVPPHVLVSRRRIATGDMAAFFKCSGDGRTLKGRDLRHFRNTVLRLTGFLEG